MRPSAAATADPPRLPDHLAPLAGERWAVWRWVCLRGAGFPIDRVLALADPELAAAADHVLDGAEGAEEAFADAFGASTARATAAIREVAADPAFREALAWQNRRALHTGVDYLVRMTDPGRRHSRQRQNEALTTNYIERYCAKNDTIGFFGPVGWARVTDDGPLLRSAPGPSLLASRTAYFEGWCIDTLAEVLARDEGLLPWLAPRPMPYLRLEGRSLRPPLAPPVVLGPTQAAVLQCCDGQRSARDVAALVLADPSLGLAAEEDVFAVLRELRASRWIAWTLELPNEGLIPERRLRRLLERVGDERRRVSALAALDELEGARRAVEAAAGDAAAVDRAMEELEATFVRLTETASTRLAGETYAGRTLVYEDCRRDADVRLGPDMAVTLGPALSLILDAAAWLTAEAADVYLVALDDVYDRLAARSGPVVPFASFWFNVHHLMFQEDETPLVELLTRRLRERWASVLPLPAGERRVRFDVEEVRPRAARAFGRRRRGWRSALYHSPDLLLAGSSAEAISEGRFEYVLGEVHASTNTLRPWLWVSQHPSPDDLLRAAERDQPEPLVIPIASRGPGGVTLRMSRAFPSPKDYRLMIAADTCDVPAGRALPAGALEVERVGARLEVRTRGGNMRFDILDVMGDLVSLQVLHTFQVLPPSDYTPRVNVGPLVVARETWRFPCASLAFAEMQNEADRFVAARRWQREHGMPRFVFIRTRHGEKPVFVDFDSLLSIDVLARAVRRPAPQGSTAERVATIVEMLPTPDQMWLTDAEGRRYASELRMVAVDRDPWDG